MASCLVQCTATEKVLFRVLRALSFRGCVLLGIPFASNFGIEAYARIARRTRYQSAVVASERRVPTLTIRFDRRGFN
jgi:hypothetical protein